MGISDNGELTGCANADEKKINNLKSAGANFCPDARVDTREIPFTDSNGDDDFVLLLRVRYHGRKVVRHVNGKAYWRIGEEKREIPDQMIRELENDFGQSSIRTRAL